MDHFTNQNTVSSNRILYTPSEFAKNNLLHLQETGTLQALSPHTNSRCGLQSYLFFVVKDGQGTLNYADCKYELTKGDCVFIDCNTSYSHTPSDNLWTLSWVHFYGTNMSGIYQKYLERGGRPCFKSKSLEEYMLLLDHIYELAASTDYIKDMKICEKLTSLLTLLMADSWGNSPEKKHPAGKRNLQDVKNYIDLHFHEKIMLDELADKFFINKFYLTRIFKEQFDMSVSRYIMLQRITHAKKQLRFTDHSMEEIALECGLNDSNYFSRVFHKIEGISPGEYRRQW